MRQITTREARILYVLAKNGGPVRGRVIAHATARWGAEERQAHIKALIVAELIEAQTTPPEQSKGAGFFYWLTELGQEAVVSLVGAGMIKKLPDDWRQKYGTAGAA